MTQELLKKHLHYNKNTGDFTWILPITNRLKSGDIAGTRDNDWYNIIRICGERHAAHRLAWLYMTGDWPSKHIDHINQIKSDNRWCNLRECDRSQNSSNITKTKQNTSGYKGVHWCNRDKKWISKIMHCGVHYFIGKFITPEEAHIAYCAKALELHGNFASV
jgi:hypothetical protein